MSENSYIALEKLRELILRLQAEEKVKLPSRTELTKEFGIGQRAIRRALSVLEAEGLVSVRQGSGVFIGTAIHQPVSLRYLPNFESIIEVMEVRIFLEPRMCELAAINIKRENISRMEIAMRELKEAKDFDSAELWDGAFHREIALAAKSPLLLHLFDQINLIRQSEKWRSVRQNIRDKNHINLNHKDHSKIYEALRAKDGAGASKAMKAHINRLLQRLRANVED